jgi:hypothetical protein
VAAQQSAGRGPSGYERQEIARNLLILKREKKHIEDLGKKYFSMILMDCEGL